MDTFPLPSVTVNVTVLFPRLAHVNKFGETVMEAMVQLSVDPLLIVAGVTVSVPDGFNAPVKFWQITVGSIVSMTVTVEVQPDAFPFTSVTVNVTVFAPKLEHVKLLGKTVIDAIPHPSLDPLWIVAGVMVNVPDVFKAPVKF